MFCVYVLCVYSPVVFCVYSPVRVLFIQFCVSSPVGFKSTELCFAVFLFSLCPFCNLFYLLFLPCDLFYFLKCSSPSFIFCPLFDLPLSLSVHLSVPDRLSVSPTLYFLLWLLFCLRVATATGIGRISLGAFLGRFFLSLSVSQSLSLSLLLFRSQTRSLPCIA